MWGILHILNFHQWHSVKKMLPLRRHSGGRNAEDDTKNMEGEPEAPDTSESQVYLHPEVANILNEEKISGASPTKKKSGTARMRKLIADAMSKQSDRKHRSSVLTSRLLRTDSLHHLESSYQHLPDEVRIHGDSPRVYLNLDDINTPSSSKSNSSVPVNLPYHKNCEVCYTIRTLKSLGSDQLEELRRLVNESDTVLRDKMEKKKESMVKQKALSDVEIHRDVALYQSKEFLDALEIFSVKKPLLLKILEDPNYALAHHFRGLWASNTKKGLTRSGTFPVANFSEEKIMKRIEPKRMKVNTEIQGNLDTGNTPSTLGTNEFPEDYEKCSQLVAESNADSVLTPDQGSSEIVETDGNIDSSHGSTHESKKRGHKFKVIKHRIKHAIRESRKEHHRISMDAFLHRIPYGRKFSKNAKKGTTKQWKESAMDVDNKDFPKSSDESESSTPCSGRLCRMRRTSSLNESLDRYAQLFEFAFNTDGKPQSSDRSKMINDEGRSPLDRASKSLGRILSLPDLECFRSLQCEVTPDVFCSAKPTWFLVNDTRGNEKNSLSHSISKGDCMKLDIYAESRKLESLPEVSQFETDPMGLLRDSNGDEISEVYESGRGQELGKEMVECSSISQNEQENVTSNSSSKPQASPISVLNFSFQDGAVSSPGMFFISEGQDLEPRCIQFDELESSSHFHDQPDLESSSMTMSIRISENRKVSRNDFDSDRMHVKVKLKKKDEADFNYIKDVLKISGFLENKYLGTWHSPDQPLDPSLFEEMESLSHHKLNNIKVENIERSVSYFNHQLLFDTINEVLFEIHERSFTYWPGPLSCNSSIRPMPVGSYVLEEVWASISWYLCSQSEDDPSLDYVVTRDLSKVDGWMNLQFESECVGLELEELILNDLLDEIIYT